MRVGVLLVPTDPWPETVDQVQRLEALGYDHLWVYDHLSWKRYRDRAWYAAIPWLSGVAGVTGRVRIGTLVASPNFRHPVSLCKEAVTVDHVSAGRFTLGLGAGGVGFDATVFGASPLSPGARAARLEEFVGVVDRLLREPLVSHEGQHYTVHEARSLPGCVQQPRLPLAIAAAAPRTLALAARHADIWVTYGDASYSDTTPVGTERIVRSQATRLEEECAALDRDPASLRRLYLIGNTDERPLASVEAFIDFAGRYRELGFTDLAFHHPRPGDPVWTEPVEMVEKIAVEALSKVR